MQSVRSQLTCWYIGSISLLVLIFSGIAFVSFHRVLIRNLDLTLYNGGQILGDALSEFTLKNADDVTSLYEPSFEGDEFLVDELDGEVKEIFFVNVAYIQLLVFPETFDPAPLLVAKTETLQEHRLPFGDETYQALGEKTYHTETVTDVFPFPLRVLSVTVYNADSRPYILQLALSLQEVNATLRELFTIFGLLFPALLIILSVLGAVFMKRAFWPVKKIVMLTRKITAEDLSLRLEQIASRDEIGELAETLNEMISRLEHSFNQIQQFSGDVAHELKTPLAELKCNAEVALRRDRTSEEYQEALQDVIEDVERLRHIIEDLLLLAKMDARSLPLNVTPVVLNELFLEVFEQMHSLAQKKKLAVSFGEIDPVTIIGDVGLLRRLITNLLSNAIRYTPSGGTLTFALHTEDDHAVLTVADTGVGIPDDALPYIFDRFYRVEQSRSHETGGSGLGLAIAQKIVEVHDGKIDILSEIGKGTTFQVFFKHQV